MLQRFDVEHQLVVVREKVPAPGIFLADLAADQPLANKDFTRFLRIHRPEVNPLFRIDQHPVKRRTFEGNDLHRLLLPVRIEPAPLDQMCADLLQPLRFDARHAAGKEPGRFGDLGGGDPLAGLLVERRSGMDQELHPACAEVMPRILGLASNVAEQAGEQCAVDRLVGCGNLVLLPLVFGGETVQLTVNVAPLAHAQRRQKIFVTRLHQLALRFLVLDLGLVPVPQLEPGEEFRLLVGKLPVRGVGTALALLRALARVLHGQRGGDHQHLAQTTLFACGDDHARHARVERHLRQFLPDRCQRALFGHRAEFEQELVAVADRLRRRRLDEGEILDIADAQRLHAQNHPGQRRAQDFGVGIRRAQAEFLLVIQAYTHSGRHPPATPGPLVGRGLGDLLDLQVLDLVAIGVALDARQP